MQKFMPILAATALIGSVHAAAAQDSNRPVKDSSVAHVGHAAEGANSFTEAQARGRLEKAGYTQVSELMKDAKGRWTGTAMKQGKKAKVALDYKGNVTEM